MPAIYEKLEWLSREDLIKHFVSSEFNRFLDYYKNSRDLNASDNQGGKRDKRSRDHKRDGRFSRLFINVGSKNKLTAARLLGLINEGLDSGDAEIGKIEILKKFSFFEIEQAVETKLIKALKNQTFEGVPLAVEVSKEKPRGASSTKDWSGKQKGYRGNRENKRSDGKKRSGGGDRRKRKQW